MTNSEEYRLAELIERRLNGTISGEESAELESALLDNREARELFLDLGYQHAGLQMLEESLVQEKLQTPGATPFKKWRMPIAVAAACLILGLVSGLFNQGPNVVANLVSSENAAWESSLPTNQGADLIPGYLRLKTGMATIRFRSGAEVVLEAPAHLVLETAMKGKLLAGSAVIDVPESAIGFIMETPDGYAVDHGTSFAVSVDPQNRRSGFEVLSGEISVHHPPTGSEARLTERQSSQVTSAGLVTTDGPLPEGTLKPLHGSLLRIGTGGKAFSVIKSNDTSYLHEDMLMAKRSTVLHNFDRRSFFAFDVADVDLEKVISARIRLNLVPSGLGFAARLPEINQFAIYGINRDWPPGNDWESSPTPEQGIFLGRFEVPRSRQTGGFSIETEELLQFLRDNKTGLVSCLVIRETIEKQGSGLVHAFASDSHPEASGPVLELTRIQ